MEFSPGSRLPAQTPVMGRIRAWGQDTRAHISGYKATYYSFFFLKILLIYLTERERESTAGRGRGRRRPAPEQGARRGA